MTRRLCLLALTAACLIAAPTYLVLLKGTSALAWYSPEGKLLASVPVGEHPHEAVFSPDGKFLYTTDNGTMKIEHAGKGGNTVSIIDVAKRQRVGTISLGENYRPHGIDVDKATGRLVVSCENPDGLLLVDPVSRKVLRRYDTKGKTAHMVVLGPGAKWAYVSHSGGDTVGAVNMSTGEVKLIQTGARAEGSTISPDGREVYVGNREAATISVIDTAKNSVVATIQTGKGPVRVAVTPDGNTLVYALMHENKVAFADAKTRRQTGYVLLPNSPVSCTLSRDGSLAFASAEEQGEVHIISVKDRKLVGSIKTAKDAHPDHVKSVD